MSVRSVMITMFPPPLKLRGTNPETYPTEAAYVFPPPLRPRGTAPKQRLYNDVNEFPPPPNPRAPRLTVSRCSRSAGFRHPSTQGYHAVVLHLVVVLHVFATPQPRGTTPSGTLQIRLYETPQPRGTTPRGTLELELEPVFATPQPRGTTPSLTIAH